MGALLRLLALALALLAAPAQAEKRIAISFDDVPRHACGFMTPDERAVALIAALAEAGVEQAGFFVTTGNLETAAEGQPEPSRAGSFASPDALLTPSYMARAAADPDIRIERQIPLQERDIPIIEGKISVILEGEEAGT